MIPFQYFLFIFVSLFNEATISLPGMYRSVAKLFIVFVIMDYPKKYQWCWVWLII